MSDQRYGLPIVSPESVGMNSADLETINTQLQELVEKRLLAGAVVAVAKEGKLVYHEAIGFRDVSTGQPMTPDTLFRIYSMTKPITGVATMMLCEQGLIALDDPIASYLPEFREMQVIDQGKLVTARTSITVRHLLTHTSGLSYSLMEDSLSDLYREAGIVENRDYFSAKEYVEKLAAMPLLFEPGSRWNYSESMAVLGRLIEVVSGQSLGEFFKSYLFEPLAMHSTGFNISEQSLDNMATCYSLWDSDEIYLPDERYIHPNSHYARQANFESGGSGLVSCIGDYLRFAQGLVNGGDLDGYQFLDEKTVNLMLQNQLPASLGGEPLAVLDHPVTRRQGMGFGLSGAVVVDPQAAGLPEGCEEFGWGGFASTDFWIDRGNNLVGMVFAQVLPAGACPTRQVVQEAVYRSLGKY